MFVCVLLEPNEALKYTPFSKQRGSLIIRVSVIPITCQSGKFGSNIAQYLPMKLILLRIIITLVLL
jgi:hypothetical protein